jgi:hypothetical protein
MEFEFDVFDDPSIENATATDLGHIATETGCTLDSRTLYGPQAAIKKAWNLGLLYGWPMSRLREHVEE